MMRQILLVVLVVVLVTSCGDNKSSNKTTLLDSSGNINNVSVVITNDMWEGHVGDAVRNVLATPVYGLPQDEPMFTLAHIPPKVFSGFVTKNRTILKIEPGNKPSMAIKRDVYAEPQKIIIISGATEADIIKVMNDNAEKILDEFKTEELKELQRRINKSVHHTTVIKEKLGVNIKFPTAYRIAKQSDNFYWIRKDITTGTTNLLIYELPLDAIKRNDSVANQIIKIRDSIGKTYIEGGVEGSYMVTENAYTPFHGEAILDNKPALETKGIWDLKNGFMGGPFINYAIEDKINNRWVVAEGFAFAPSVEKRNYIFELEAIIKSITIE